MMPMMIVMLIIIIAGIVFAWQGVNMHFQVPKEEAQFHSLQEAYWSQSKALRDVAETGSDLNARLVEIKNFPSRLLELKLVGIGKILAGIFLILLAILIALMAMPMRLSKIMAKKMGGSPMQQ